MFFGVLVSRGFDFLIPQEYLWKSAFPWLFGISVNYNFYKLNFVKFFSYIEYIRNSLKNYVYVSYV